MITDHQGVLIIAEAGVNHNGEISRALALVDAAADAGADVVKFQTFKSDQLVSSNAPKALYQQQNTAAGESQLDMIRALELSASDHLVIKAHAEKRGIAFLSTPFDPISIQQLHAMGITVGKVPSGELTNLPYLRAMARSFPELIVSTGMADMREVATALAVLEAAGASLGRITLLHCTTEYPTPMSDVNLLAMCTMRDTFGTRVGYSDHTMGIEVPIAAVALGATIIEKHLTLDRALPGPDHRASLEPAELNAMVNAIRNISVALGSAEKAPSPSERANIVVARKSIHIAGRGLKGQVLEEQHLIMLRPGSGISPMQMDEVIGRILAKDLEAGHMLQWNDLI